MCRHERLCDMFTGPVRCLGWILTKYSQSFGTAIISGVINVVISVSIGLLVFLLTLLFLFYRYPLEKGLPFWTALRRWFWQGYVRGKLTVLQNRPFMLGYLALIVGGALLLLGGLADAAVLLLGIFAP